MKLIYGNSLKMFMVWYAVFVISLAIKTRDWTYCNNTTLPPNALRRDCNGKCIELIEGHALEVVVEVFFLFL